MIRASSIPTVLNRICDDKIHSVLLVTTDGELMGASTVNTKMILDTEAVGALLADVGVDYARLGEEFAGVDATQQRSRSHLQCLLVELELGLVGLTACIGIDCMVIAIAKPDAPLGLVKAKLQALAAHVQESFSTLTESSG